MSNAPRKIPKEVSEVEPGHGQGLSAQVPALGQDVLDNDLVGSLLVDGIGEGNGQPGSIRAEADTLNVQQDVGVGRLVDGEMGAVFGPYRVHRSGKGEHDLVGSLELPLLDETRFGATADQEHGDQQEDGHDCRSVLFHLTTLAWPACGRAFPHN
jgi:hypothetical protein